VVRVEEEDLGDDRALVGVDLETHLLLGTTAAVRSMVRACTVPGRPS
jgi:hypothetical protein